MKLSQPVEDLPMVNKVYAQRLSKINIHTVEDLVFYFPVRYDDFSTLKNIEDLRPDDSVTIRGAVEKITMNTAWRNGRRLIIVDARIRDKTGTVRAVWFNQFYIKTALEKARKENQEIYVAGNITDKFGLHFSSPTIESTRANPIHTNGLIPVYQQTKGVTSRWLRYAIHHALSQITVREFLPKEFFEEQWFVKNSTALSHIHFPQTLEQAQKARTRFNFEKLFIISLANLQYKSERHHTATTAIPTDKRATQEFINSLSFSLTDSQTNAIQEILRDISNPTPMNRLLEGDVGSGKTVVALAVAFNVIKAGRKVAFMVPTEILATQHHKTITQFFSNFDIQVSLLTKSSKENYAQADIVIGTHALIQKNVVLQDIGLVVIDEQHRFGVSQRASLLHANQTTPHLLSMTATPIPRTLALTMYGDLDISFLKTLPTGRKPIQTYLVRTLQNTNAHNTIQTELQNKRQVFVIFPLIEESEKLQLKAAEKEYEILSKTMFENYSVGLLHGRMKQAEKDAIMERVVENDIQVLVSTSIVEVGVDVPNATVMIIEEAHRFGLAQLHQFRGRVGRSTLQSYCFLVSQTNNDRLDAFVKTQDGFSLAKKDLQLRGGGQLYGTQQSGLDPHTIDLIQNPDLVELAHAKAQQLLPSITTNKTLNKKVQEQKALMHPE